MLVNPANPVLVGSVSLSTVVANCATFTYAEDWWEFALSEDLPTIAGQMFSAQEKNSAPGAIDDARPDRWGERIIRYIDRPARLSILEMLLFAGDARLGAISISTSAEHYIAQGVDPCPVLGDLQQLAQAVEAMESHAPLTAEMERLLKHGGSLGGARPKALLQTGDGPACIIKFSESGDTVDAPLVEHAAMKLATMAGINVASTNALLLPSRHSHHKRRHALTVKRFDRIATDSLNVRLHCISAKTALAAAGLQQSYGALATVLLRQAHPERQRALREELFKRMVFNILIDNTDDHERNHCLRLNFDGYYDLAPAFDVLPTLLNLGYQSLGVGSRGHDSSIDNALTALSEFGLTRPRAIELIKTVALAVDRWQEHFLQHGVSAQDMEQLAASIDRDALKLQRREFC